MVTTPQLDLMFPNTHSLYTIGVIDISQYPQNYSINYPAIEITAPGRNRIIKQISPSNLNIYNSSNLEITCGNEKLTELPDGLWEFKYSISPQVTNFVEKKFLKVDLLKKNLEEAFMKLDMLCEEPDGAQIEVIQQIGFMIDGAIASANRCDYRRALKQFEKAQKMLSIHGKMH